MAGDKFTDVRGNDTTATTADAPAPCGGTIFIATNADDTALSGVTIVIDANNNSTFDAGEQNTTTGTDGAWSFTGLGTGLAGKKVFEILPTGDVQTLGSAGYAITGTSGANQTGLN